MNLVETAAIYSATGTATGTIVGGILARTWAKANGVHPLKMWREHIDAQKQIATALDTTKPGGLTDVVNALNKENR